MNPQSWRSMVDRSYELLVSLGDGVKVVEKNEKQSKIVQRRCLRVAKNLKKGHVLVDNDFIALRPISEGGFESFEKINLIGKELLMDIDAGEHLTKKLINESLEVALYGPPLPRWAFSEIKVKHTNQYIVKEDKAKVFGSAMGVLNSTAMSEFDSVNCRAFEIAGCGGLHVLENRKSIETCFIPGKEVLTYDSFEELLEIVKFAKTNTKEILSIREAGCKRAHAEHTYENRLEYILTKI
jgi:hypothetical protein